MAFCNQISATATFSVRLRDGTPEKAAEMVRYTNIEKGYGIQYWSIGNEPTLYTGSMGRNYDTAEFNQDWRAFAKAMKAVDPSILLMGPEVHQFTGDPAANPKDSEGLDWMTEFLKANGDLVDVVTIHRYPFPKSGSNAKIEDLRQNTQEWDSLIVYLRGLIHEITGRDIPIAITEVASHYSKAIGGEGTPDSFYNAIWWGDVLGRLIRGGVLMVNQWMLTSYGGYGGWGLVTRGAVLPTYYTYQMYQHLGDELLLSSSDDPFITITAAKRDDGTLTLLVINLKDEPVVKPIQIKGLSPIQEAETWLLDLAHNAENLGMQSIPVDGLHLTGQSITFLIISP